MLLKDQNKVEEMVDFAHRACRLYQQQGSSEAGAGALEKTAKMVESKEPAAAINVLQHAVEVLMVSELQYKNRCNYNLFNLSNSCSKTISTKQPQKEITENNVKLLSNSQIEDSASRQAAEHLSKISRLQIRIERYVRDF